VPSDLTQPFLSSSGTNSFDYMPTDYANDLVYSDVNSRIVSRMLGTSDQLMETVKS
jgi:hypothetical protein